ncbi:class I SAM-dependent RNA methyltransferase [uncultured Enterovirga sp.]|uniref:class I SAM-dependent RNA methyltransferase n=1 Tax=uncultured Enterovirga sp. TaxID=2026352 RepID=UPI0035CBF574
MSSFSSRHAAMIERVGIERLGSGGDGIGDGEGGPLFVPYSLPGEIVTVERREKRARLIDVERASPDRIEPFCPYHGRCGGCVAQHIAPGLYESWKRGKVVAALERAGLAVPVDPLRDAHGEGRRRITLHGRVVEGEMRVGYMEAGSHSLVEIAFCPVSAPGLDRAPAAAAILARDLAGIGKPLDIAVTMTEAGLDIDLRGSGPPGEARRQRLIRRAGELDLARLSVHGDVLIERRPPGIRVGDALVLPPPGAFLQATSAGEEALATAVAEALAPCRRVADLFAGMGPFALRLARRSEVHAVDGDGAMLAALDRAFRATPGLRRVTVETRDLFRRPLLPLDLERFDGLVLDPPRSGAEAQVAQLILSSLERVVMVSCDPGTFARDAASLVAGGFAIERVLPVDQFKWTAHVEIVGVFRRSVKRVRRRR